MGVIFKPENEYHTDTEIFNNIIKTTKLTRPNSQFMRRFKRKSSSKVKDLL